MSKLPTLLFALLASFGIHRGVGQTFSKEFNYQHSSELGLGMELIDSNIYVTTSALDKSNSVYRYNVKFNLAFDSLCVKKFEVHGGKDWNYGDLITTSNKNLLDFRTIEFFDSASKVHNYPVLTKFDLNLDTLFSVDYGYSGYSRLFAKTLYELDNGDLLLIMAADRAPYGIDLKIYHTDSVGLIKDELTFSRSSIDEIRNTIEHPNGSFYLSGVTGWRGYWNQILIKMTLNPLKIQWSKSYESRGKAYAFLQLSTDGNLWMTGDTLVQDFDPHFDVNETRRCVYKLDTNGNVLLKKTHGLQGQRVHYAKLLQLKDGSLIGLAMHSTNLITYYQLQKLDRNGDSLWLVRYSHNLNFDWADDHILDVEVAEDGGFYMVGSIIGSSGTQDLWLIKTDSNGECSGISEVVYDVRRGIWPEDTMSLSKTSELSDSYMAYPIPTNGILHINHSKIGNLEIKRVTLVNKTGQRKDLDYFENLDKIEIDLSGFSPGIYFLTIESDTDEQTLKIIKQ